MSRVSIEAVISKMGLLALDERRGADLLAMSLPDAAQSEAAGRDAVERYRVERGVAVMPVRGVLTPNSAALERWFGWSTYAGVEESAGALAGDDSVGAVVLVVDSPGGAVLGLQAAAQAVAALAQIKPVYALVNPLAASAAYWLASQAREISVTPGGAVGSIGVGLTSWAYVEPANGVQMYEFTSPHARAKWPDPSTDEGKVEFMRVLSESESDFHDAVSAGRGIDRGELAKRLSVSDDPADGGAVFKPADALARGLADRIETVSGFFARVFAAHAPDAKGGSRAFSAQARARAAVAKASI